MAENTFIPPEVQQQKTSDFIPPEVKESITPSTTEGVKSSETINPIESVGKLFGITPVKPTITPEMDQNALNKSVSNSFFKDFDRLNPIHADNYKNTDAFFNELKNQGANDAQINQSINYLKASGVKFPDEVSKSKFLKEAEDPTNSIGRLRSYLSTAFNVFPKALGEVEQFAAEANPLNLLNKEKIQNDWLYQAGKYMASDNNMLKTNKQFDEMDKIFTGTPMETSVPDIIKGLSTIATFQGPELLTLKGAKIAQVMEKAIMGESPSILGTGLEIAKQHASTVLIAGMEGGAQQYETALSISQDAHDLKPSDFVNKYKTDTNTEVDLMNQYINLHSQEPGDVAAAAFKRGVWQGLPFVFSPIKLINTIDGLTANAFSKAIPEIIQGGANTAIQMAATRVMENLTAQETYDQTRKITDGVINAGINGGVFGLMVEGFKHTIGNLYSTSKDVLDKNLYKKSLEYLDQKEKEVGDNYTTPQDPKEQFDKHQEESIEVKKDAINKAIVELEKEKQEKLSNVFTDVITDLSKLPENKDLSLEELQEKVSDSPILLEQQKEKVLKEHEEKLNDYKSQLEELTKSVEEFPIPKTVNDFVSNVINGVEQTSPEDLQFYENNKEEIEKQLVVKQQEKKTLDLKKEIINNANKYQRWSLTKPLSKNIQGQLNANKASNLFSRNVLKVDIEIPTTSVINPHINFEGKKIDTQRGVGFDIILKDNKENTLAYLPKPTEFLYKGTLNQIDLTTMSFDEFDKLFDFRDQFPTIKEKEQHFNELQKNAETSTQIWTTLNKLHSEGKIDEIKELVQKHTSSLFTINNLDYKQREEAPEDFKLSIDKYPAAFHDINGEKKAVIYSSSDLSVISVTPDELVNNPELTAFAATIPPIKGYAVVVKTPEGYKWIGCKPDKLSPERLQENKEKITPLIEKIYSTKGSDEDVQKDLQSELDALGFFITTPNDVNITYYVDKNKAKEVDEKKVAPDGYHIKIEISAGSGKDRPSSALSLDLGVGEDLSTALLPTTYKALESFKNREIKEGENNRENKIILQNLLKDFTLKASDLSERIPRGMPISQDVVSKLTMTVPHEIFTPSLSIDSAKLYSDLMGTKTKKDVGKKEIPTSSIREKIARERAKPVDKSPDDKLWKLGEGKTEINIAEEVTKELQEFMPEFATNVRVENIIEKLEDEKIQGYVKDGIITLNTVTEKGVKYHEAFHNIFRLLFNDSEIGKYLKIARNAFDLKGEDLKIEEKLADKFQEFNNNNSDFKAPSLLTKVFRDIKEWLGWASDTQKLDNLFSRILEGKYKNRQQAENRYTSKTYAVTKRVEGLPTLKSQEIIYTVANILADHRFNGEKPDISNDEMMDNILDNMASRYNLDNVSDDVLEKLIKTNEDGTIDDSHLNAVIFEYNRIWTALTSEEARNTIKEETERKLKETNADLTSIIFEERDDNAFKNFDLANDEVGGMFVMDRDLKAFMSFCSYPITDELGRSEYINEYGKTKPITVPIELAQVYRTLEANLSAINSPEGKLQRLDYLSKYDPQINAVWQKLKDVTKIVGTDISSVTDMGNKNLITKFTSAFDRKFIKHVQFVRGSFSNIFHVFNSNVNNPETKLVGNWHDDAITKEIVGKDGKKYENIKDFLKIKENRDEIVAELASLHSYINTSGVDNKVDKALNVLTKLGISPSRAYLGYCFNEGIDGKSLENNTLNEIFKDIYKISDINKGTSFLQELQRTIIDKGDIYSEGGVAGRLKTLAKADQLFRTDLYESNFQAADGSDRFSYVQAFYKIVKMAEIKESILNSTTDNREFFDKYINSTTSPEYTKSIGWFKNYAEASSEEDKKAAFNVIQNIFRNMELQFSGDAREGKIGKNIDEEGEEDITVSNLQEGVTAKASDARTYALTLLANWMKKDLLNTVVNADKSTSFSVNIPKINGLHTGETITDKAITQIFNEIFKQESDKVVDKKFSDIYKFHSPDKFVNLPFINKIKEDFNKDIPLSEKQITEVKDLIKEHFNQEHKDLIDNFIKLRLISKDSKGNLKWGMIEPVKGSTPEKVLGEFMLNHFISSTMYNQVIDGDISTYKDYMDYVKRMAGDIAAGPSIGKGPFKFVIVSSPEFGINKDGEWHTTNGQRTPWSKISNKEGYKLVEITDGQAHNSSANSAEMINDLGRMTKEKQAVYDKIINGDPLSVKEQSLVDEIAKKTVYNDGNFYLKESIFSLSKELTSWKNKNGIWQPIPGMEYQHNLREYMEHHNVQIHYATTSKKNALKDVHILDYNNFLTKEEEHFTKDNIPEDLHKDNKEHDKHLNIGDKQYLRLQTENETAESHIKDPSQNNILIDSEIDTNKHSELGNLRDKMQSSLSLARNQVFDIADKMMQQMISGKNSYLMDKLISTNEGGASSNDIASFLVKDEEGKPKFNFNLPTIRGKIENMMMSHFSKGVFGVDVEGSKYTINSGFGHEVLHSTTDSDIKYPKGSIIPREEFLKDPEKYSNKDNYSIRPLKIDFKEGYMEVKITRKSAELNNLSIGEINEIDPKILEGLGIRIPTQWLHSVIRIKPIDFLPEAYGDSMVVADGLTYLSGTDFDLDKLFVKRYAFYKNSEGKLVVYGKAKDNETKFEEYKTSLLKYDRNISGIIKDELKKHEDYKLYFGKDDDLEGISDASITDYILKSKEGIKTKKQEIMNSVVDKILREFDLPTALKEYEAKGSPESFAGLMNHVLEAQEQILSHPSMRDIANTPATTNTLEEINNEIGRKLNNIFVPNGINSHLQVRDNVIAAKSSVGVVAKSNVVMAIFKKLAVDLNNEFFDSNFLIFDNQTLSTFKNSESQDIKIKGDSYIDNTSYHKTGDWMSELVSAVVDAVKGGLPYALNLNNDTLGIISTLVQLGNGLTRSALFINQPAIREYVEAASLARTAFPGNRNQPETQPEIQKSYKVADALIKKYENLAVDLTREKGLVEYGIKVRDLHSLDSDAMLHAIRSNINDVPDVEKLNYYYTQIKALEYFKTLKKIEDSNTNFGKILNLNREIGGATFEGMFDMYKAIDDLQLLPTGNYTNAPKLPYDTKDIVDKYPVIKNNIDNFLKVYEGIKPLFFDGTNMFKESANEVKEICTPWFKNKSDNLEALRKQQHQFISMQLLRKIVLDDSGNPDEWSERLFKGLSSKESFADAFSRRKRENKVINTNLLIKELSKKTNTTNSQNKGQFQTIDFDIRQKMTPSTKEKFMNSAEDLRDGIGVNNMSSEDSKQLKEQHKDLFRMSAAKDGLTMTSKGMSQMFSPEMFKQLSDRMKTLNEILARNDFYKDEKLTEDGINFEKLTGNTILDFKKEFRQLFTINNKNYNHINKITPEKFIAEDLEGGSHTIYTHSIEGNKLIINTEAKTIDDLYNNNTFGVWGILLKMTGKLLIAYPDGLKFNNDIYITESQSGNKVTYIKVDKTGGEGRIPYLNTVKSELALRDKIKNPPVNQEGKKNIETLPKLQMQPDNIEKIFNGEKTATSRTFEVKPGIYELPNDKKVKVLSTHYYDNISKMKNPEVWAKAEGFKSLEDMKINAKYQHTKDFINGKRGLYISEIKPIKDSEPDFIRKYAKKIEDITDEKATKREIGILNPGKEYSNQQIINIKSNIKQFNRLNGTTHRAEITQIGKADLYKVDFKFNPQTKLDFKRENEVQYNLKVVDALNKSNSQSILEKGIKNKWEWWKIGEALGIPKQQIDILQQSYEKGNHNVKDLVIDIAANNSYVVEINTAKDETGTQFKTNPDGTFNYNEIEPTNLYNSQYYSNLTVPGGTNYTENEISTPMIEPSIKGHAQFSTNNGIGWFRGDDKTTSIIEKGTTTEGIKIEGGLHDTGITTKNRRILEIQSDLFQKGKNNSDLVKLNNGFFSSLVTIPERIDLLDSKSNGTNTAILGDNKYVKENGNWFNEGNSVERPQNQFLQLLNKDNNWVTFFTKSIIQDSAKKGYKSVLFPLGDTAAKVEGHQTMDEFISNKEGRLNAINSYLKERIEKGLKSPELIAEKQQIEKELQEAKEGKLKISSIHSFYENTISNILKKQGYSPKVITDEYGNKWNKVEIKSEYVQDINLKRTLENKQADNTLKSVLNTLKSSFGKDYNIITEKQADELLKNTKLGYHGESAFNYNEKTYYIEGRATASDAYHEYGHFLTREIMKQNPTLFNKLIDETLKKHPELLKELFGDSKENRGLYHEREYQDINGHLTDKGREEFVNTAIEYAAANPEKVKTGIIKQLLSKIWNAIKSSMREIFGDEIKVSKLNENTTLAELGEMLKSGRRFNLEENKSTTEDFKRTSQQQSDDEKLQNIFIQEGKLENFHYINKRLKTLEVASKAENLSPGKKEEYQEEIKQLTNLKNNVLKGANLNSESLNYGGILFDKLEKYSQSLDYEQKPINIKDVMFALESLDSYKNINELSQRATELINELSPKFIKAMETYFDEHKGNNEPEVESKGVQKDSSWVDKVRSLANSKDRAVRTLAISIKEHKDDAINEETKFNKEEAAPIVDALSKWGQKNGMNLQTVIDKYLLFENNGKIELLNSLTPEFFQHTQEAFSKINKYKEYLSEHYKGEWKSKEDIRASKDEELKSLYNSSIQGYKFLGDTTTTENGKYINSPGTSYWNSETQQYYHVPDPKSSYHNKIYEEVMTNPKLSPVKDAYLFHLNTIEKYGNKMEGNLSKYFAPNSKITFIKQILRNPKELGNNFLELGKDILDIQELPITSLLKNEYSLNSFGGTRINIPSTMKSRDLFGNLSKFVHEALSYEHLSQALIEAKAVQKYMSENVIYTERGEENKIKESESSTAYKLVESMIRMQILGKTKKDELQAFSINWKILNSRGEEVDKKIAGNRAVDIGMSMYSLAKIGLSPFIGVGKALVLVGANIRESGGTEHFNPLDVLKSFHLYGKDLTESGLKQLLKIAAPLYTKDMVESINSKTSLIDKLATRHNIHPEDPDALGQNRISSRGGTMKRFFSGDFDTNDLMVVSYSFIRAAKHIAQCTAMFAYDIHNGLITSDGKDTGKWDNMTKAEQKEYNLNLNALLSRIHGPQSNLDQVVAKETLIGRQLLFLGSWKPNYIEYMWGKEQYYRPLDKAQKGVYRSVGTVLKNTIEDIYEGRKYFMGLSPEYSEWSDIDKRNLGRFTMHCLVTASTIALSAYLSNELKKSKIGQAALTRINIVTGHLLYMLDSEGLLKSAENLLPITSLIHDLLETINDVVAYGIVQPLGGSKMPTFNKPKNEGGGVGMKRISSNRIKSGVDKGESKIQHDFENWMPYSTLYKQAKSLKE